MGMLLGNRYRITSLTAQGGMGAVWYARDERLDRICVVKGVLLHGLTPQEQAERRAWFDREAELLSHLNHPAICKILDLVTDNYDRYLVLEHVPGHTLMDELSANGAPGLPEDKVVSWGIALCDALAMMHRQTTPIIFRDLKPSNVMLRPDGHIILIDFGIARLQASTTRTMIGSPGYAPIEQYHGHADARSDIYALGATMHHLLTGRSPDQHQQAFTFPPVKSLNLAVSPQVDAAIAQSLQYDAAMRFQSAFEFAQALGCPGVV